MDKNYVIERLEKLPNEIAAGEAELLDQEQELLWSQINLRHKQNEFQAMQSIAKLL